MHDTMTAKADDGTADARSEVFVPELPPLTEQAERLIVRGLLDGEGATVTADDVRDAAVDLEGRVAAGALLIVSERVLPPGTLMPHLTRTFGGRERDGFIVIDMEDVDDFVPTSEAAVPSALVYAIEDPRRGDELRDRSPAEAQEALSKDARTPFTIAEGLHWALQLPVVLDRNACYMMIGSRRRKTKGFDSRTPALWISNGTGRDGRDRQGAPKLGWCWWNNRHTWLGFASGSRRVA